MNFMDYINASLDKGSIGAYISVGIFVLIGVAAVFGTYYGARRGFSKSVIRLFTVVASAVCALLTVTMISNIIVKSALEGAPEGAQTVDALLNGYFPGFVDSLPEMVQPILAEMDAGTTTIFVMMIISVLISPILFISFFYIFKAATFFLYKLLAGLTGAISYGKSPLSTISGAAVGLIQGLFIAGVIIVPISGLCNVADEAKAVLLDGEEEPNAYIETAYSTVINDLSDNPVFDFVDHFGGNVAYDSMITVSVNGEKMDMGEKCVGAVKIVADVLPIADPNFNWKNPTDEQRQAFADVVVDVGEDDLIAALASDVVRGIAKSIRTETMDLGLEGPSQTLVNDVMEMFATSNRDTIQDDLDVVVDVYFIMCDRDLIDAFTGGSNTVIREMLTTKDEHGETAADVIIARLNEYDRAQPIVTSFTKLSLSMMHISGASDDADQLYEDVKGGLTPALSHNRNDFDTEEEYREAVTNDLDKALADNNLKIEDDVKESMVDYITENYGDFEGEITDKEINDALLSYYQSYADRIVTDDDGGEGSGE